MAKSACLFLSLVPPPRLKVLRNIRRDNIRQNSCRLALLMSVEILFLCFSPGIHTNLVSTTQHTRRESSHQRLPKTSHLREINQSTTNNMSACSRQRPFQNWKFKFKERWKETWWKWRQKWRKLHSRNNIWGTEATGHSKQWNKFSKRLESLQTSVPLNFNKHGKKKWVWPLQEIARTF